VIIPIYPISVYPCIRVSVYPCIRVSYFLVSVISVYLSAVVHVPTYVPFCILKKDIFSCQTTLTSNGRSSLKIRHLKLSPPLWLNSCAVFPPIWIRASFSEQGGGGIRHLCAYSWAQFFQPFWIRASFSEQGGGGIRHLCAYSCEYFEGQLSLSSEQGGGGIITPKG
jgi:hypothetical protein